MQNDAIVIMAEALSEAHAKYVAVFGETIHGTQKQFAALLELCPQMKSAIELWDKRRIEMETV